MNKFKEFIKKAYKLIGNDGILNFAVCFGICAILAHYVNLGLAFFIPVVIGFAKEIIWDGAMKKGQFQWKDIWCDIAGALAAALLVLPTLFM